MSSTSSGIRIAVEGCGHGTLNNIYSSIMAACKAKSWPGVDLLIIGGDFQAVRNSYDLNAMAVPAKYREIGDFQEYYSGKRKAPYLTIFIGGNHEASNHLTELYYGGWVAPNIYYMGAANVLRLGPLRIAGMSGIWKGYDYRKPHFERLPYKEDDKKSVYHVRELDVRKLLQLRSQVDMGLSHDWPEGIQWCGDWKTLFRNKKFLEADARSGRLGNIAAKEVLQRLRPQYWFSAHLHTKFAATVKHKDEILDNGCSMDINKAQSMSGEEMACPKATELQQSDGISQPVGNEDEIKLDMDGSEDEASPAKGSLIQEGNPDEIDISLDEEEAALATSDSSAANISNHVKNDHLDPEAGLNLASTNGTTPSTVPEDLRAQLPDAFRPTAPLPPPEKLPFPEEIWNRETNFLALDKCLPNRHFLQLLEIPAKDFERKSEKPFGLEYDKEWLAITRVFAKDLVIGNERARVPRDAGEAEYQKRIQEELVWVEEHIVRPNIMDVPENFELTAPTYDPAVSIQTREFPIEYLNPQTEQFCTLIGIDNPLRMSDADKARRERTRIQIRNESQRSNGHARGGYRGRGGRGRGNRGGRGRGY